MNRIFVVVFMLLLCGCAPKLIVKDGPMHDGKSIDIFVRPEQSLGVQVTPAIKDGTAKAFEMPLPDRLIGGEMYPGRIRWNGWGIAPDGSEGLIQFVFAGVDDKGEFRSYALSDVSLNGRVGDVEFIPLSSLVDFAVDGEGKMHSIDAVEFAQSKSYRKELVAKHGTRVGKRKAVKGLLELVRGMNLYSTRYGEIYSPLSLKEVKEVAGINPAYSFMDKLVLKCEAVISINPIHTAMSVGITIAKAMFAKSQGWDYMSELPTREQMAMIVEYLGVLRKNLIQEQAAIIAAQNTEKGDTR